jgi:hypothetical protein
MTALRTYEPHCFMPEHRDEADKVSFFLAGAVYERHSSSDRLGEAGWMVVKPAGALHEDRVGSEGLTLVTFEARLEGASGEAWSRIVSEYRWMPADRSLGPLLRLHLGGVASEDVFEEIVWCIAAQLDSKPVSELPWYHKAVAILQDSFATFRSIR